MPWSHTACRARASIASLLGLLVVTLAEVVGATVHDNGAAENALRADQLDELVRDRALGVTLAVSLEVAKVTNVTLRVRRGSVGLAVRVDYAKSVMRPDDLSFLHHGMRAYSEGRQRCSRWCCRRRRERAYRAQRWHRCR